MSNKITEIRIFYLYKVKENKNPLKIPTNQISQPMLLKKVLFNIINYRSTADKIFEIISYLSRHHFCSLINQHGQILMKMEASTAGRKKTSESNSNPQKNF